MTIRKYVQRGDIFVPSDIPVLKARLEGLFRIQRKDASGQVTLDTGWFGNVITDLGMDQYGSGTLHNGTLADSSPRSCCVGTGTTVPTFSDTTLQSPLALSPFSSPIAPAYVAGPPAYIFQNISWAFPLGGVIGNISEVGAGAYTSTTVFSLANFRTFSRQLILDSLGNPTTIACTSADQLNVSYQVRLYYDLTDSTVNINISGTNYGGTIRRALTGLEPPVGPMNQTLATPGWSKTIASIYNGNIGTTSSTPGGSAFATPTHAYGTYIPGSFTNTVTSSWGTTALPGTVLSGFFGSDSLGFWQFQLLPGFAKTSSNILSISWSLTWARH